MLSPYDRPSTALANLVAGNPVQAWQALAAPNLLDPGSQQTLGDTFVDSNDHSSITRTVMNVFTNPIFVIGALMSLRYPIASAAKMFQFKQEVANAAKHWGPIMRQVGTMPTILAGTGIPESMEKATLESKGFEERHGNKLYYGLNQYLKETGQKEMSPEVQRKIAAKLDGLDVPGNDWQKSWEMTRPLLKPIHLDAAEQKVFDITKESLNGMWQEGFEGNAQTAILEALYKKGYKDPRTGKQFVMGTGANSLEPRTVRRMLRKQFPSVNERGSWEQLWQEIGPSKDADGRSTGGLDLVESTPQTAAQKRLVMSELVRGGFMQPEIKKIDDHYFPHQVKMSRGDYDQFVKSILQGAGNSGQAMGMQAEGGLPVRTTNASRTRHNLMLIDERDVDSLRKMGLVDERAASELDKHLAEEKGKDITKLRAASGEDLTTMIRDRLSHHGVRGTELEKQVEIANALIGAGQEHQAVESVIKSIGESKTNKYSLQLFPVLSNYLHRLSVQYGWTVKGHGKDILASVKHMESLGDSLGPAMMRNEYIPMMLGRPTFGQTMQSLEWADTREKWITSVNTGAIGKMLSPFPGVKKWLTDKMLSATGPVSFTSASGGIAKYFYGAALGGNFASAVKNTLQTFLTTVPLIGPKFAVKGMKDASSGIKEYLGLRFEKGMDHELAFAKAFPHFVEAGMDPNPITDNLFKSFSEDTYEGTKRSMLAAGRTIQNVREKVFDKMMLMFQTTERWNRLVAFYGGRGKALAEMGNKMAATSEGESRAVAFGRRVTEATQFPAGPGQSPRLIQGWPSILRQFLHFPLRYAEFLGSSLQMPYGEEGKYAERTMLNPMGLNLGTIGRGMAWSTGLYEVAKHLGGVDLSSGLMSGALPLPQMEGSPFYPLPMVPPIVGIAGNLAMAAYQGDSAPLKKIVPLLIPGGVAGSRAWRFLSPDYADYNNPTPDGRIKLTSQGGSMVGYFTPLQLVGKALGMGTMDQTTERNLMEYLLKQRDTLRGYRQNYLGALAKNDMKEAVDIQDDFKKHFPTLGGIQVKQQDVQAVKLRGQITRLERVLDTLPKQYREQYGQMVSVAMGQQAQELMGVDPSLLGAPGTSWASRPRTPTFNSSQQNNPGLQSQSQSWGQSPGQVNLPVPTGQGFGGFGGF